MDLIPIEPVRFETAAAHRHRRAAGKLANAAIGLDDLVIVVHRYAGDNFGVQVANVGACGPIPGESRSRPLGLFTAEQVTAFGRHYQLIGPDTTPVGSDLDEFIRTQAAPLGWQGQHWAEARERISLWRPLDYTQRDDSAWRLRRWLQDELVLPSGDSSA